MGVRIGPLVARGEEAGSGHYLPGTTADFIGLANWKLMQVHSLPKLLPSYFS